MKCRTKNLVQKLNILSLKSKPALCIIVYGAVTFLICAFANSSVLTRFDITKPEHFWDLFLFLFFYLLVLVCSFFYIPYITVLLWCVAMIVLLPFCNPSLDVKNWKKVSPVLSFVYWCLATLLAYWLLKGRFEDFFL